jgi:hypothetical protein
VFQIAPDGRFIAYHAGNGKKVFERQMETKTGMGPPITFLVDGKQYVAFMGGAGLPEPSPTVSSPKLFAFALEAGATR